MLGPVGRIDLSSKQLFYDLTREGFIRSMLLDYKSGNINDESINARKIELCVKYGIKNTNLDTYSTTFSKNHCFICDSGFSSSSVSLNPHLLLKSHSSVAHVKQFGYDSSLANREYNLLLNEFIETKN